MTKQIVRGAFCWAVTGTFHGSIIEAKTEGEARRIFHKHYNGESITNIKIRNFTHTITTNINKNNQPY